eukprot:12573360-Prorocentrum_lima.AAC.1
MSLAGVHGPGCGASPTRSPCRGLWSLSRRGGEVGRLAAGNPGRLVMGLCPPGRKCSSTSLRKS